MLRISGPGKFDLIILIIFTFIALVGHSQNRNTTLLGTAYDDTELSSDIWGFADSTGTEYALVSYRTSFRIFNLEDPTTPKEIYKVDGVLSEWRDIKTYQNYAYVIADRGQDGVLIVDMNDIPNSFNHKFFRPEISVNISGETNTGFVDKCHNIFIDDGILYFVECKPLYRGVLMFDLKDDPMNPKYLGNAVSDESHDIFVRDNIIYSADVWTGNLSITDVSNKTNPVLLALEPTPNIVLHATWLSDDSKTVFVVHERPNEYVSSYDISDLDNITLLDRYRPFPLINRDVYPHNIFYRDGYLYISHYTDGIIILDVHRPENMVEVANYDTYPGADGGFHGCWGVYPFLPSGNILASDIEYNLFVIKADLVRASYLEGNVYNSVTDDLLSGVSVKILIDQENEVRSDDFGNFKTGIAEAGTQLVEISHRGFLTDTIEVEMKSGEVTIINHPLVAANMITVSGSISGNNNLMSEENGIISFESKFESFITQTNDQGKYTLQIPQGLYDIHAGKWSNLTESINNQMILESEVFDFDLTPGFIDNFETDLGWTINSNANTGGWVREKPIKALIDLNLPPRDPKTPKNIMTFVTNPGEDSDDEGSKCFITGNGNGSAGRHDLDNGISQILSPKIDLKKSSNPTLTYKYWFVTFDSGTPKVDTLRTYLIQDGVRTELFKVGSAEHEWQEKIIPLSSYLQSESPFQIMFEVHDTTGNGHITEAGIDFFQVSSSASAPKEKLAESHWSIYPNPSDGRINITIAEDRTLKEVEIFDLFGRLIQRNVDGVAKLNFSGTNGLYFVRLKGDSWISSAKKILIER
jgi:choice-of-anchor B domain-containing protein